VLAVMVDFVSDEDPLTTGSGRFDTTSATFSVLDPPPHDRGYFRNHLLFLANYWRFVTNEKLIVAADLVDTVVHLPRQMRYYSPLSSSTTNRELGLLVNDTWIRVDSLRDSIDFRQYQAFCIFHAGVGRDIDLTSLLGYDPTPWDIPSLYMDSTSLRRAIGASYRGVPVRDSTYFITNTMILPETESRLVPSFGGQSLLQLGINGLLAASLGSYLGLPDLFDTRSGRSAIGRFGLMDGQSIFSWNGVFPPEPSAWEKLFLKQRGLFDSLVVIDALPGEKDHWLPAATLAIAGSDTILRVPISTREYFLVENRNRDAHRNGAHVWLAQGENLVLKTFARDTVGFDAFDQRSLGGGVVVDVDEYDWSLPGGVSTSGEFFDGGVLIWHVDESVIDAGYASNTVNADPRRRGIDLEEADGSQDIGQSYGFVSPGAGSEAGTALDFWYSGNSAPVYRNAFSLTTYPNSLSNTGASSHLTIKNFSPRDSVVFFRTLLGDSLATPLSGYPRFVARPRADNSPQFERAVFIASGDSIFAFKPDSGVSATSHPRGLFWEKGGQFPVALTSIGSDTTVVVGVQDSVLLILFAVDGNADGVFEAINSVELRLPSLITTAPLIARRPRGATVVMAICVGDASGNIQMIGLDTTMRSADSVGSAAVSSLGLNVAKGATSDSLVAVSGSLLWREDGRTFALPHASSGWQIASLGEQFVAADVGGSSLILLDAALTSLYGKSVTEVGGLSPVAIADVDADGHRDVVFASGRNLNALNLAGASLDYFPVTLPKPIVGAPIITRLMPNSSEAQVFVTTADGMIYGLDNKGRSIPGFPLAVGGFNRSTPAAFALPTGSLTRTTPALFVSDSSGYLSAWRLQAVAGSPMFPWSSFRGNPLHTANDCSPFVSVPQPSEFLPAVRAYNWPNPVYDGKTFIRYYLKDDAAVRITILDLDGQIVDAFAGPGNGGLDNEVEWDASKVQSGVYFGHIEARSGSQSGVAIIKIAVVK
jgi:hypothetical protein